MERDLSEQVNYYLSEDRKRCLSSPMINNLSKDKKVVFEQVNYHLSVD